MSGRSLGSDFTRIAPLSPENTDTVTDNTFQFLGVPALLGRGIVPGDGKPGAPPVFVLSYKVWVRIESNRGNEMAKTSVVFIGIKGTVLALDSAN